MTGDTIRVLLSFDGQQHESKELGRLTLPPNAIERTLHVAPFGGTQVARADIATLLRNIADEMDGGA